MTAIAADGPLFALVDDHIHSARLMSRTLRAAPDPAHVLWLGNARRAAATLARLLERPGPNTPADAPDMVIVDLKARSDASAEFISRLGNLPARAGVPVVAFVANDAPDSRRALVTAGASAVFLRRDDLPAYRAEMEEIMKFWVRETVTWPIRA